MSIFITDDFLLSCDAARELYHKSAERLPIVDYHCHLSPQQIAENTQFSDITQLWLVDGKSGDHYKWRAMRANGVGEEYITGDTRNSWEKFEKWAETVPYTMRNPLYHWTHMELSRAFGIDRVLKPGTAREIFEECNAKLATEEYRAQSLIRRFNVETICTTDDPADDLRWHRMIAGHPFGVKVLPAWRPDNAMAIENPSSYRKYLQRLAQAADIDIRTYSDLCTALSIRHLYFAQNGCGLSDHGTERFYSCNYTGSEIEAIFAKVLAGHVPDADEICKFKSAFLHDQAVMDAEAGWVQQFHVGAIRNNNSRMMSLAGPDTGYDSIHDFPLAADANRFFDRLTSELCLAKTIVYCLNPKDYQSIMTMVYNFNDGTVAGKMQFGAGWWFLDQEVGIRRQIDTLSSLGLLSRFVGMLTDSRSFISYPRHEYFRRILCDIIGRDVETGRLPRSEMDRLHGMVSDISYHNAASYFGF